jgi:hypothetical protein
LASRLGLCSTRFVRSSELNIPGYRTDRLINIVKAVGCNHYITGPAARGYLEEDKFPDAGVTVEYMEYTYPQYPQLYPPFDPHLSILDLLMMTGGEAPHYIWAS